MKDEIKEILEQLEWYRKIGKKDVYYPKCVLPNKKAFILLDYITNLQEELKEYKMLFDAFSERPYAHRYLEEKKKELGNSKIIGLDSEMIYKDYYDLQEENERLKKDNLLLIDYQDMEQKYDDYKLRNEKAIEYIKENIADIEFMEENYDLDFLNKNEIEVEYKDIKKLIELLEEVNG